MKNLLIVLAIFCALSTNAQNYLISFAGTGASTSVSTVKVENLTKGTTLTISGSDILRLTTATGINSIENNQSSELKIYPNPMTDNATLEIFPPVDGNAFISVYDMTGKLVVQIKSSLEKSKQEFRLSGLENGFYLISVEGRNYHFSGKLLCIGKSYGNISVEKVNNIIQAVDEKVEKTDSKGIQATVDMPYSTGDKLKFTGTAGSYSTVLTTTPIKDLQVTFDFIPCIDGDNINYPVVKVGTQTWMAENLKTTKYRNSELIGTTTPATLDLTNEDAPKYQWAAYQGDENTVAIYGRLYTWYAAIDSRNVCPTGWHVPTDIDWTTLVDYLTNNGYGYGDSGNDIAKSMAATSGWTTDPTAGNVGNDQLSNNSSGFTALWSIYRNPNGYFGLSSGGLVIFWSTLEYDAMTAWVRLMTYFESYVTRSNGNKKMGNPVRCLLDN